MFEPPAENSPSSKVESLLQSRAGTGRTRSSDWEHLVRRQAFAIARINLKRLLSSLGFPKPHRGQLEILAEYDRQWRKKKWEKYRVDSSEAGAPWVWRDRQLLLSNELGAAVRLIYLDTALSSLRPRRVLEVGSGNGINLLLLAAAYPGIEFSG